MIPCLPDLFSIACDNGTYGQDCLLKCFCRTSPCDKVTGLCPPGGCLQGWDGQNCNESM